MKEKSPSCLIAYGNTYNPSLLVLREKGYDLWIEEGQNSNQWYASKGSQSFLAYSGPELLGLVVLWETLGENWNQQEPNVLGALLDERED